MLSTLFEPSPLRYSALQVNFELEQVRESIHRRSIERKRQTMRRPMRLRKAKPLYGAGSTADTLVRSNGCSSEVRTVCMLISEDRYIAARSILDYNWIVLARRFVVFPQFPSQPPSFTAHNRVFSP